jgi:RimJ/RimL family protein N-acetyltransferase
MDINHVLAKDMTGGHSSWYVVEDATRGREIAGCVSATVDHVNGRAYSRGMMVRPGWQGKGGASRLFGEAFQDFMVAHAGKVRLVWAETRATSIKPQSVCEAIGLQPVGILPSKDVFFNKRETPVIMAIYASNAWASRDPRITLIPELQPLHDLVATMFRPMKKDAVQVIEPAAPGKARCKAVVNIEPYEKKYGYTTYIFTCEKTGEAISINVNHQCMNAEGLEVHCSSAGTTRLLLSFALGYLRAKGVAYVEGYCPATRPDMQEAFLAAGLVPFGYVPAWSIDARSGLFVDHVVFGWSKHPVDASATSFTAKSGALAKALGFEKSGFISFPGMRS